jgi:hypothetical protein
MAPHGTLSRLPAMRSAVHYIPILTTVVSVAFASVLFTRWRERGGLHLFWWGLGMVAYGAGTLTESLTTIFGWQEGVFRAWYITGALLGGMPLAQGSAYLHLRRRTADAWALIIGAVVVVAAVCVILSPINVAAVEPYRLSGRALEWSWVRLFSPFVNLYAVIFLVGGAIVSAMRFSSNAALRNRFIGNVFIAIGGILPGIGGMYTRLGYVEVLYVTELLGLALIYVGYRYNIAGAPMHRGQAIPLAA